MYFIFSIISFVSNVKIAALRIRSIEKIVGLQTSSLHREAVRLVHDTLLQARTIRTAFAGVGAALHVHGEWRARDGHVVVENVDGVTAFFERCVADAIRAVTLRDDQLLRLTAAGIIYGAGHLAVVGLGLGDISRVYCERRLLVHE